MSGAGQMTDGEGGTGKARQNDGSCLNSVSVNVLGCHAKLHLSAFQQGFPEQSTALASLCNKKSTPTQVVNASGYH
jgi:hypothetical protein